MRVTTELMRERRGPAEIMGMVDRIGRQYRRDAWSVREPPTAPFPVFPCIQSPSETRPPAQQPERTNMHDVSERRAPIVTTSRLELRLGRSVARSLTQDRRSHSPRRSRVPPLPSEAALVSIDVDPFCARCHNRNISRWHDTSSLSAETETILSRNSFTLLPEFSGRRPSQTSLETAVPSKRKGSRRGTKT